MYRKKEFILLSYFCDTLFVVRGRLNFKYTFDLFQNIIVSLQHSFIFVYFSYSKVSMNLIQNYEKNIYNVKKIKHRSRILFALFELLCI